jgi:hypothetical protein
MKAQFKAEGSHQDTQGQSGTIDKAIIILGECVVD